MVKRIRISKINLILIIGTVLLLFLFSNAIPQETIQGALHDLGIWAPIILTLLILVTFVIAPLSGTAFVLAGFYLYGANIVFLAAIAAWISSIINFWVARRWGRPFVKKMIGSAGISRVDKLTENRGLIMLFFSRVLLSVIHELVSYAAGLTSMKFSSYFIASTLGSIPGTAIWYYLTLKVSGPLEFGAITLGLIIIFTAIFFISATVYKRLKR